MRRAFKYFDRDGSGGVDLVELRDGPSRSTLAAFVTVRCDRFELVWTSIRRARVRRTDGEVTGW